MCGSRTAQKMGESVASVKLVPRVMVREQDRLTSKYGEKKLGYHNVTKYLTEQIDATSHNRGQNGVW